MNGMYSKLSCFLFVWGVTFLPAHASESLSLNMSVFEEVITTDSQGNNSTQLIEPNKITPGDTVVYVTQYHNKNTQAAHNVVITNPIPGHLIYLNNSAQPNSAVATYSVDNGKTFNTSDKLTITTKDNTKIPAEPKDYTHIRWLIHSIAAGGKGSVRFSAKLK